jgi:predicted short-subunit dehydrogenase-like oxidoreductase (DUF2520 family)
VIDIVILGAGNVAMHLYTAFKATKTVRIIQLYNRTKTPWIAFLGNTPGIDITDTISALKNNAHLYLLAVADDAVIEMSHKLPFQNKLVAHTSGNLSITACSSNNNRGVFYPLQTFSKNQPLTYSEIPFCIEAETETNLKTLQTVAEALSPKIYYLSSEQRKTAHLAAVFANNFTNHLYHIAAEICKTHQLPFELLQPIIMETAKKITHTTPFHAQTGPARRGDVNTLSAQVKSLQHETYKQIYQLITQSILKTYENNQL